MKVTFEIGLFNCTTLGNEWKRESRKRREVQGHMSVGKDEYIGEGKKFGRNGRVRRATFDDLKAIIDINDDVYDGLDYMEAFFYTCMHSKLHVIYVHEEDGKLVGLSRFI